MLAKIQKLQKIAFVIAIATAVVGFLAVWTVVPQVGGEWWPYIHALISVLGALIVGKVALLMTTVYIAWNYTPEDFFDQGNEDSPWEEDEIEDFVDKFDNK